MPIDPDLISKDRSFERGTLNGLFPSTDSIPDRNEKILDLPNQNQITAQQGRAVIAQAEQLLAEAAALIAAAETREQLESLEKREFKDVQTLINKIDKICNPIEYDKVLNNITDTINALSTIASSDRDRFRAKERIPFDEYDFHTPNALKERECDALVEAILDAYKHKNCGRTVAERRNVKLSTWEEGYVPPAVKELVAKRSVSTDANLDAEHAAPIIQLAQKQIREHLTLADCRMFRQLFRDDPAPKPAQILRLAQEESLFEVSPLLSRLNLLMNDYAQRQEALTLLLPLKEPLLAFETRLAALIANQEQAITAAEERRAEEMRFQKWKSIFANEQSMEKALFTGAPSNLQNTAEEIVRFASEGDKDLFAEKLIEHGAAHAPLAHAFMTAEIESLDARITAQPESALDECLARFPRIAHIAYAFRQSRDSASTHAWQSVTIGHGTWNEISSFSENSNAFERLVHNRNFPAWMINWQVHHEDRIASESASQIERLSENCAAFGRFHGEKIPHLPAISLNGDRLYRERPAQQG